MIPEKLKRGDEIRVIAPSGSLAGVWLETADKALAYLQAQGFKVTFSKNSREMDEFQSSSVQSRVEDLHEAFLDPNVKMVMSCIGGFNANQILKHLDFELISNHPKILCGYSDITALLNAIYAKTGLVTYHGPHFSTFGFAKEAEYTQKVFFQCLMEDEPIRVVPSETVKNYHVIQEGTCEGEIIGGNLCTLNLLQGTPYMPKMENKVLFIEDDNIMGDYFVYEFDRNLQSLLQVYGADTVKGIVFGQFDDSCKLNAEVIRKIVKDKVAPNIPVIFGVDFGHIFPMITFPIGGMVRIRATGEGINIDMISH